MPTFPGAPAHQAFTAPCARPPLGTGSEARWATLLGLSSWSPLSSCRHRGGGLLGGPPAARGWSPSAEAQGPGRRAGVLVIWGSSGLGGGGVPLGLNERTTGELCVAGTTLHVHCFTDFLSKHANKPESP